MQKEDGIIVSKILIYSIMYSFSKQKYLAFFKFCLNVGENL